MGLSKYAAPLLLLAMFLPCFIAFCTRPMSDAGMSFMDIMFVRLSIASAGLFLIVLLAHRSLKPLKPNRRDIVMLVFFGIFKFLSDYTYIAALDTIDISLATLLQNTAPYFVMILCYFLFKDKVSRKIILIAMLGSFGCVLMAGAALFKGDMNPLGIAYAVASAFCMSLYYIGNRMGKERGYTPAVFTFYLMFVSTLITLPFLDIGTMANTFSDISMVARALILGVVTTLIPYYIVAWSMKYLNPMITAVICVSEVFFAAMMGALYFNETMDVQDYIGIIMLASSIVLISRQTDIEKREKAKPADP